MSALRFLPHAVLAVASALAGCRAHEARPSFPPDAELPPGAECRALDGRALFPPELAEEPRTQRERELESARYLVAGNPDDPLAWIWLGRRTAYTNRFRESLALLEAGAARFPSDPRFPRHVGHRQITLRRFADAERSLARAARLAEGMPDEVEPAGLPNARGVELSTRNQEIQYHLALARYLRGDFDGAAAAWSECLRWATNDDARLAATTWLYAALRRAGRHDEAREAVAWVHPDIDVVEYQAYFDACRAFAGLADPEALLARMDDRDGGSVDDATLGYALANWLWVEGRHERARALLARIATGPSWHAFGAIAAEADLARAGR